MLSKYLGNYCYLKVLGYGENKIIKLVNMKFVKNSGFDDVKFIETDLKEKVNENKLSESISRAKSKIFELAMCNEWDYFFTGTLDKQKYNRSDLEIFHKDFTKWLQNQGRKYNHKIDFLLIPELHSDMQSWHIHGLLHGVPECDLKQFQIGDNMGKSLADKVLKGDFVFNWLTYQKKFGFCDLEPIKNPVAVSKYVTKYITKNLSRSVSEVGAHLYYRSRGLETSKLIAKGFLNCDFEPTFKNEYCKILEVPFTDELYNKLISNIQS